MTGGSAPAVLIEGVTRNFGARWVLRGVSMRVQPGEAVALLGRNGSGKTTLLRIICTLLRPTRGRVEVFGHDAARDPDAVRERVGLLGHAPGLYEDLTAGENLRFAYRMYGLDPDAGAIRTSLERVGLGAELDSRVRGFSAGMRRRLSLARILVRPPRLLLLDEPYASFDADGVAMLNELVVGTKARGDAVVLVTHDPERAAAVCDRRVAIADGRVVEAAAATAGPGD